MIYKMYEVKIKGHWVDESGNKRPFPYHDNIMYGLDREASVDDLYAWMCFSQPSIVWDKNSIEFKFAFAYDDQTGKEINLKNNDIFKES